MNHGGSNAALIGSSHQLRQREQAVQAILSVAHSHIQQGDTTGALQVVFELLREVCGEAAVHSAADRVESQLLRLRLQPQQAGTQSAADQLADMLTCCNIGTQMVQPEAAEQNLPVPGLDLQLQHLQLQSHPPPLEQNQQPLLMELRGMQLGEDGVPDDASFICPRCGGIFSKLRQMAHMQMWCQPPPS